MRREPECEGAIRTALTDIGIVFGLINIFRLDVIFKPLVARIAGTLRIEKNGTV